MTEHFDHEDHLRRLVLRRADRDDLAGAVSRAAALHRDVQAVSLTRPRRFANWTSHAVTLIQVTGACRLRSSAYPFVDAVIEGRSGLVAMANALSETGQLLAEIAAPETAAGRVERG